MIVTKLMTVDTEKHIACTVLKAISIDKARSWTANFKIDFFKTRKCENDIKLF